MTQPKASFTVLLSSDERTLIAAFLAPRDRSAVRATCRKALSGFFASGSTVVTVSDTPTHKPAWAKRVAVLRATGDGCGKWVCGISGWFPCVKRLTLTDRAGHSVVDLAAVARAWPQCDSIEVSHMNRADWLSSTGPPDKRVRVTSSPFGKAIDNQLVRHHGADKHIEAIRLWRPLSVRFVVESWLESPARARALMDAIPPDCAVTAFVQARTNKLLGLSMEETMRVIASYPLAHSPCAAGVWTVVVA